MKTKISIIGAGGLGREVLALLRALPEQFEVVGFYDDIVAKGTRIMNVPVLGTIKNLKDQRETVHVVVAIGNPQVKEKIVGELSGAKISYPVVIHPSVVIGDTSTVTLGEGTVLTAGVKLTVDIQVGKHVLINLNSTIGHNTRIGDFASVMPGVNLAGDVTIGRCVLLGSGSNIINRVTVGDGAKIGSGSVVISNITERSTAVGVPAKIIK